MCMEVGGRGGSPQIIIIFHLKEKSIAWNATNASRRYYWTRMASGQPKWSWGRPRDAGSTDGRNGVRGNYSKSFWWTSSEWEWTDMKTVSFVSACLSATAASSDEGNQRWPCTGASLLPFCRPWPSSLASPMWSHRRGSQRRTPQYNCCRNLKHVSYATYTNNRRTGSSIHL